MLLTNLSMYFPGVAMIGNVKCNKVCSKEIQLATLCFLTYRQQCHQSVLLKITREEATLMTYLEPSQASNMEHF